MLDFELNPTKYGWMEQSSPTRDGSKNSKSISYPFFIDYIETVMIGSRIDTFILFLNSRAYYFNRNSWIKTN